MLYAGWSMPLFSCDLSQQVDCPDFEVAGGFALRFPSWFIVLHFLGAPTHTFEISWRFMTSRGLFFEHIQKHTWRKTLMHVCRLFIQKGWNQQIRNSRFQTSAKKHTQKTRLCSINFSSLPTTVTPSFKKPRNKKTAENRPRDPGGNANGFQKEYNRKEPIIHPAPGFWKHFPNAQVWKGGPQNFLKGANLMFFFWNSGWKSCGSIGMKTNM